MSDLENETLRVPVDTHTNTNPLTFRRYCNSRLLHFFLSHWRSVVLQYLTRGKQATTICFTYQPITEAQTVFNVED